VDIKELSDRVMAAKNAVLFLAFIPETPSITDFAAAAQKQKRASLRLRGDLGQKFPSRTRTPFSG
jgi:hypothetical protein